MDASIAVSSQQQVQRRFGLSIAALSLVFGGALLAHFVQTSGGVQLRDVRFQGTGGLTMSALLYVPPNATPDTPAPGVLAVHGYINSRETQSPYAIELARRGYVVLALDQTGHGYSSPPSFANGYGGPDGLTYLRGLDIVDKSQIVLEGHSMGGWASLIAAGAQRDAYRSIVVSGSSTGTLGAPDGDATFPRNLGLVVARFDEFSGLMWGAAIARDVVSTSKLKKLFGTEQDVQVGHLYGSIEAGSARQLYMPDQTHPMNHITTSGVAAVLDWVERTSTAPRALPASDQIWYWKEIGTALSLCGLVLLLFAAGSLWLRTAFFRDLAELPPEPRGATGAGYWVSIGLTLLFPVALYVPLNQWIGTIVKPNAVLSQNLTTGLMYWAVMVGLISVGLFAAWHVLSGRARGAGALHYGLAWREGGAGKFGRTLLLALATVAAGYAALVVCDLVFKTDFRMWVVAAKPLSALQAWIWLCYVVPFSAFFVASGIVLHGQLRSSAARDRLAPALIRNAILTGGGFVLFMLVQYVPLFSGSTLAFPDAHLLTILAIQLLIVLPITGLLSTYFFYRTGHVYAGAFVNGLWVTWLLVGGQATHFAF